MVKVRVRVRVGVRVSCYMRTCARELIFFCKTR